MYFFLCLYKSFSLLALGAFDCIIEDLTGFLFGVGQVALRVLFPQDEESGSGAGADHKPDQEPYKDRYRHRK